MNREELLAAIRRGGILPRTVRRFGQHFEHAGDRSLIRNALRMAGIPNAGNIETFTRPEELTALYRLACNSPQGANALEIGSHLGASACYLGAGLKTIGGTLYCVDTWNNETMPQGTRDTYSEFSTNIKGLGSIIRPVRKRSGALKATDLALPIHLAFIDGDHNYLAVKEDFETLRPWLAPSAIVAFHDTVAFEGVARFFGETLALPDFRMAGHVGNLSWIQQSTLR